MCPVDIHPQFSRIIRTTTLSIVAAACALLVGMVMMIVDTAAGFTSNDDPLWEIWFKFVVHVPCEGSIAAAVLYSTVTGGFLTEVCSSLRCRRAAPARSAPSSLDSALMERSLAEGDVDDMAEDDRTEVDMHSRDSKYMYSDGD